MKVSTIQQANAQLKIHEHKREWWLIGRVSLQQIMIPLEIVLKCLIHLFIYHENNDLQQHYHRIPIKFNFPNIAGDYSSVS